MEETITKRLHISGLTPALTSDDLFKRISAFGTVKAIDGFGLSDALGQPRKFGYVTLETTQPKLHKCLNSLSGSTWKGAKLRIGEAKPDFAQRLAAERESATLAPPRKNRRRISPVHASDMSLVTPENVAGRNGWKVTPLGRILRPIRMRPERPLPRPGDDKRKQTLGVKKKSKKVKNPDVRARRRKIDMTRYGSAYLKGMFLQMDVVGTRPGKAREEMRDVEMEGARSETEDASQDETRGKTTVINEPALSTRTVPPADNVVHPYDVDMATEKVQNLSLLASIFGNKDDHDWIGRESVGSDVDEAQLTKDHHHLALDMDDDDLEIVPMDAEVAEPQIKARPPIESNETTRTPYSLPTTKQQQAKNLKDLFAPRDDNNTFSLLGHLELDLELDDDIPFAISEGVSLQEPTQNSNPNSISVAPTTSAAASTYSVPQLNNKLPLFFPLPSASTQQNLRARPKDIFDVARENKWHWRDPSVGFFRTGTEEEIREQWENSKVELTRDWKRRWKEAGKINRRRRHGVGGDVEGADD